MRRFSVRAPRCGIYGKHSVFDDVELIEDSIDALCEDDRKTLCMNISRIRKKIKDKGWRLDCGQILHQEERRRTVRASCQDELILISATIAGISQPYVVIISLPGMNELPANIQCELSLFRTASD